MARRGCLLLVFLITCGSSCLLYTDPINHPPTVKLTGDAQTTWGEAHPKYHAEAHDPDQSADSLIYEWRRQLGACPKDTEVMVGTPVGDSKPDFQNDVDFADPFCVWVVVRDKLGATDHDGVTTQVLHNPTIAVIDVVKPSAGDHFPLLSMVQLSGARSHVPESEGNGKLAFKWTLTRGAGDPVTPGDCPDPADSELCFTGDKEGMYLATLTVTDSRNGRTTAMKTVTIDPDRPPCLEFTDPMFAVPRLNPSVGPTRIVRDATDDAYTNYFEVKSVSDDVDPFPALASRPSAYKFTYTWWLDGEDWNNPSGGRPADQGQTARLPFNANYFHNGDVAFVRLQVEDRVPRDFTACAKDKVDNCALDKDRPTCFQWVTWRVDFKPLRDM